MNHDSDYFWVVLCKNRGFHHKETLSYVHQILLGETDAFSSMPMLPQSFEVRCDKCWRSTPAGHRTFCVTRSSFPRTLFPTRCFSEFSFDWQ